MSLVSSRTCLEQNWLEGPAAGGIPPQLVARVSEPFFTTKERGSGFGLATVLGTVRAHRGVFHVESSEGKGSRICIWLPLLDA